MNTPESMPRPLGATGLQLNAPIGIGTAKLGAFWQHRSIRDGRRTLDAALAEGLQLIDTADCYSRGIAERIVGRAIRHRRDQVILCTKAGLVKTTSALRAAPLTPHRKTHLTSLRPNSEPTRRYDGKYLTARLEHSLRALRTDHVDVFYLHEPDEETLRTCAFGHALDRILSTGKARAIGVSCPDLPTAQAALAIPAVSVLQVPHSIDRPNIVPIIAGYTMRVGTTIIAAAPLGDGRLARTAAARGLDQALTRAAAIQFAVHTVGVACVLIGMSHPRHVHINADAARSSLPLTAATRLAATLNDTPTTRSDRA